MSTMKMMGRFLTSEVILGLGWSTAFAQTTAPSPAAALKPSALGLAV